MPRQIGEFNVLKETEIASSSQERNTSQLLCAEIADPIHCGNLLVWIEVQGKEPQIIGRYSPLFHTFTTWKGNTVSKREEGLDMSWTVVEIDGNGVRQTRKGGTLTGDQVAEPEPEMVTWRRCASADWRSVWFPSGEIPKGWVALEAQTLPAETIKQLPVGERP